MQVFSKNTTWICTSFHSGLVEVLQKNKDNLFLKIQVVTCGRNTEPKFKVQSTVSNVKTHFLRDLLWYFQNRLLREREVWGRHCSGFCPKTGTKAVLHSPWRSTSSYESLCLHLLNAFIGWLLSNGKWEYHNYRIIVYRRYFWPKITAETRPWHCLVANGHSKDDLDL